MRPKTELLLYHMLWTAGKIMRPTFRNVDESFEGWAYRNGLLRQIRRLEALGLVEARGEALDERRFHRLTAAGRVAALGGRDPELAWSTPWDGKWRLFLFDVPESERSLRRKLTRSLAAVGCGCLQGSVWLSATRPAALGKAFGEEGADCSHLMILEAESRGSRVDRAMIKSAWDFDRINSLYQEHLSVLEQLPKTGRLDSMAGLAAWARQEHAAWLTAVRRDPLLPAVLLPRGYLGRRAWQSRKEALAAAGRMAQQWDGPRGAHEPA